MLTYDKGFLNGKINDAEFMALNANSNISPPVRVNASVLKLLSQSIVVLEFALPFNRI